jgi:hypothetical protein
MRLRPILLVIVAAGGCMKPQPPAVPPGYSIVIPDDVPEHLELIDKEGTKHDGKGREMYAAAHRVGWQQCWEQHQRGELDPRDKGAAQNRVPQCYGIEVRGFVDGFKGCQQYLLKQQ